MRISWLNYKRQKHIQNPYKHSRKIHERRSITNYSIYGGNELRKTQSEYEKNRERKNQVKVYLDDAELLVLQEKMKASGLKNRSDFLRQLIIFSTVFQLDYSEISAMNYQLEKIGNNINQIAHRMNAEKHIYKSDVQEIKELMEKIWQLQKSTLSWLP